MDYLRNRRSTGIVLSDFEIRRIRDDDVEGHRLAPLDREKPPRSQRARIGHDEVDGFDAHGQRPPMPGAAPIDEVIQHGLKRPNQTRIDLVGDQIDRIGCPTTADDRFHDRATENACTGGRIEHPDLLRLCR